MEFFAPEIIGPKRRRTPSGSLICYEVPIARTGIQTYRDGEVPVAPGANGSIAVQRDPEEVFHPDAIASFEGVPIVNEHPMADVTPHNWRHLSMGHCQNVRRGDGIQDHLLLADLVIQDAAMIRAIEDGKREISCGYSADYEETGPGTARQINIRGNHCAVVESARCGPQCSIQDHNHHRDAFEEGKHPRASSGTEKGGEFVKGSGGSGRTVGGGSFERSGAKFGRFGSGKIPESGYKLEAHPGVEFVSNPLFNNNAYKLMWQKGMKEAQEKAKAVTAVTEIPTKKLVAWQIQSNLNDIRPLGEKAPPIKVIKIGTKYIIVDGNHRAISAFIEGRENIKANVLELGNSIKDTAWALTEDSDKAAAWFGGAVIDKGPDTMPKSKFAALVSRALFVRDAEEAEKIKKEAEEMEEGEGESTPGAHHQVVNIHPPTKEDDDDEPDPAVEQLSQQVQAMQQQHEEMLADLDMLLEESEAGGEEDSKRWNDERDKRDAADARGRRLDDARRRQRDRAARHADRHQRDARAKHYGDARRRHDDARRRLDGARDRMEEDSYRRHDESLREMDSRLRRHGDNGMRDYNDEEMRGCEDAMKRWDDDFNSSASPIEPTEAILASLEMEAPPGTNDRARRATDSQYLEDSYRETVSMAEIIVPGIKVPTFDRAAKPKVTFDSICALRRQALEQAYATPEMKPAIDVLASGRWDPSKMSCDQMRPIFKALALQRKIANNAATAGGGGERRDRVPAGPMSLADINKMHDEYWKNRVH